MKQTLLLLLACLASFALTTATFSQSSTEDVIYLKNGAITRGAILELVPDRSVKIQTRDGNVWVYPVSEIDRIAKEPVSPQEPFQDERNRMESWYLCFALGYAHPTYPSPLQETLDLIGDMGSRVSISMDFPAVYWPAGSGGTVIGGALNLIGDRYEVNSNTLQVSQVNMAVSAMHFLTGEIGDGPFLRGDVGIASLSIEASGAGSESSDAGIGLLLGGGYAIPVSAETRILLNMNFASRRVEGKDYGAFSLTLGVML